MIKSNSQPRTKRLLLLTILLLAALACSLPFSLNTDPDTGSESSATADTGSSTDLTLDCEREGYACSAGEMKESTFQTINQYGDEMVSRLDKGKTLFEIEAWLKDQEGVTFTVTDGRALIFRVEGSVPIVIEHPAVLEARAQEESKQPGQPAVIKKNLSTTGASRTRFSWIPRKAHAAQVVSQETEVVGSQRENREEKSALILEPYFYQLTPFVQGQRIHDFLNPTRWYAGNVRYMEKTSFNTKNLEEEGYNAPDIDIRAFQGWDQYDVVHLHTHGNAICRDYANPTPEGCTTYLSTGIYYSTDFFEEHKSEFMDWKGHGLSIKVHSIPDIGKKINAYEVFLLPDFFRYHYDAGELENMILSFSACEVLFEADLVHALKEVSQDSDLFAFTRSVWTDDSQKAYTRLYRDMIEKGLTAEDAFKRMPEDLKSGLESIAVGYEPEMYNIPDDIEGVNNDYLQDLKDSSKTTSLKHHKLGQKTNHIREVITLQDPHTNEVLRPGNLYELNGVPNDGEPELIDTQFLVEGYTQEEIENEGITITFKVDGETALFNQVIFPDNPDDNVEVSQQEEYAWRVRVAGVEIPDLQPDQTLAFRAELDLPAGNGISVHEVEPLSIPRDVQAVVTSPDQDWQEEIGEYVTTHDADSGITRTRITTTDGDKLTFYFDAPNSTSYIPDGEGGYFKADSEVDPEAGMETLQEFSLPSTNFSFANLSEFPDMAAILARITVFARVNEEMLHDAGYQKRSETQFQYNADDVTNTFLFDEHGRVSEVRFESSQGNGIINYNYQDFDLSVPENTQPFPDMFDADNGQ